MIDKDWLHRIDIAYNTYIKDVGPQPEIDVFIDWLYKQYGIVRQGDNNGKT